LKNKLILIIVFAFLHCANASAQESVLSKIHLGIVTPISTQSRAAKHISPVFSLHVLQGVNKNNNGFSISGMATTLYGSNRGVLISGLINHVNSSDKGVTIAGLYNHANNGIGIQIAGLHNHQKGNGYIQIAGLSNSSKYSLMQVSGLVNISNHVHSQFAGLINIAKTGKGVQFAGLINIADSSDHPIGLLNFIKNGEQQLGIQIYDDASANLVLRTGGRKTYGIIGAGIGIEENKSVFQLEAGLGYRIPISHKFRLNAEAASITKTNAIFFKHTQTLRTLLGCKIGPTIEITAGPALYTYKYTDSKIFTNNIIWRFNKDEWSFLVSGGIIAGINITL